MKEILVVDDEKDIVEAIEYNLKNEGYKVAKAFDGPSAVKMAKEKNPALILLDLMLPGMNGLDVCKTLKNNAATAAIPIIMLTARGEEADKVIGLELGADDYLTKPFSMRELTARIKAILKRYGGGAPAGKKVFKAPQLELDVDKHEVRVAGKAIELTAKEFALLLYLWENEGKVFSRERLLDTVWGIDVAIETRTVDVHVRRLREKLGKAEKYIHTLRGVGYKFEARP
ncbi:MAG: response regulator transcription factor [Candidatus Margulisiibacteriota bacterium]|jgi:phosphate regulon transcriptional regulator PhoB